MKKGAKESMQKTVIGGCAVRRYLSRHRGDLGLGARDGRKLG